MLSVASARHHRINFASSFVVLRSNNLKRSMRPTLPPMNEQNDDDDNSGDENDVKVTKSCLDQKKDNLLDNPFFDPFAPSNDKNWFANLVRNDYESAEALYAGVVVILGVVISQQLLRIVKHGGGIYYVFHHGNGELF